MEWARKVTPRQRALLQQLGLPVLPTYDDNLAAIKFVQIGSKRFAQTAEKRYAAFMAGYRRWFGKRVALGQQQGNVLSIRVRGSVVLKQSGINPADVERIFEVFVRWDGLEKNAGWISVTQLKVLS